MVAGVAANCQGEEKSFFSQKEQQLDLDSWEFNIQDWELGIGSPGRGNTVVEESNHSCRKIRLT